MPKLVLLTLFFASLHSSIVESVIYYWKDTTSTSAVLLRLNPDGLEDNKVHTYLCRLKEHFGLTEERWVTGKIILGSKRWNECRVGSHGADIVSDEFQMLIAPPGTTSWIPSNGSVPKHAVLSGTTRAGQESFHCRAPYENSLLVGETQNGKSCHVSNGVHELFLTSNVELLAVNGYGAKLEEAGL